jgi:ketosteroid isomerase-like protein
VTVFDQESVCAPPWYHPPTFSTRARPAGFAHGLCAEHLGSLACSKEELMKHAGIALLAIALLAPAAIPAGKDDVSAPVRQFIDGFNTGNVEAAFATYATGTITIVDEFAPHIWTGPNAAHEWSDAYNKHAQSTGVTDGKVTYRQPTRTEIEGDVAYVVMPAVYLYKEHGKPLREEGQITVVLNRQADAWKIRSWTWTGVRPHAVK